MASDTLRIAVKWSSINSYTGPLHCGCWSIVNVVVRRVGDSDMHALHSRPKILWTELPAGSWPSWGRCMHLAHGSTSELHEMHCIHGRRLESDVQSKIRFRQSILRTIVINSLIISARAALKWRSLGILGERWRFMVSMINLSKLRSCEVAKGNLCWTRHHLQYFG